MQRASGPVVLQAVELDVAARDCVHRPSEAIHCGILVAVLQGLGQDLLPGASLEVGYRHRELLGASLCECIAIWISSWQAVAQVRQVRDNFLLTFILLLRWYLDSAWAVANMAELA